MNILTIISTTLIAVFGLLLLFIALYAADNMSQHFIPASLFYAGSVLLTMSVLVRSRISTSRVLRFFAGVFVVFMVIAGAAEFSVALYAAYDSLSHISAALIYLFSMAMTVLLFIKLTHSEFTQIKFRSAVIIATLLLPFLGAFAAFYFIYAASVYSQDFVSASIAFLLFGVVTLGVTVWGIKTVSHNQEVIDTE